MWLHACGALVVGPGMQDPNICGYQSCCTAANPCLFTPSQAPWPGPEVEARCSFITTTVLEQRPRSHHKGATGLATNGWTVSSSMPLPTWTRHPYEYENAKQLRNSDAEEGEKLGCLKFRKWTSGRLGYAIWHTFYVTYHFCYVTKQCKHCNVYNM